MLRIVYKVLHLMIGIKYEEHFAEPYGEGCSKSISLEVEVPPFMEKFQFLVDDYSSKDCSLHKKYVKRKGLVIQ